MRYQQFLKEGVEAYKRKGQKPNYFALTRNCIIKLYWPKFIFTICVCICSECMAITYNYMVGDLIKYIKDDNATTTAEGRWRGIAIIARFIGPMFLA